MLTFPKAGDWNVSISIPADGREFTIEYPPIKVFAIGFLLHLAFHSSRDAALIMLNLPLALIGGVAGVFAGGGVLSVASLIGFITVFGIATRNGIMLVSHIRHLQESEGVTDFREAILRGSLERLAPILMTALAAGLAALGQAVADGSITPEEWGIVVGALVGGFALVWLAPKNSEKDTTSRS